MRAARVPRRVRRTTSAPHHSAIRHGLSSRVSCGRCLAVASPRACPLAEVPPLFVAPAVGDPSNIPIRPAQIPNDRPERLRGTVGARQHRVCVPRHPAPRRSPASARSPSGRSPVRRRLLGRGVVLECVFEAPGQLSVVLPARRPLSATSSGHTNHYWSHAIERSPPSGSSCVW